jgi:hypothetical protein
MDRAIDDAAPFLGSFVLQFVDAVSRDVDWVASRRARPQMARYHLPSGLNPAQLVYQ